MAVLSTQTISEIGLDPVYVNADPLGDKVLPTRRTFIHVKNNSDSASITVSVDDITSIEPIGSTCFDPSLSVEIEPNGERFIGPLLETRFIKVDGYADISYTDTTDVVVSAFEVG